MANYNFKRCLARFLGLFALAGCSGPAILDCLIPNSGYTLHKDIAYGDNERQKLDIYVPEHAPAYAPVIVFFYGGSWKMGNKDQYRFIGQTFASRGYVTVIANYRLYPDVYFPVFVEDSARAFVWAHQHIGEYGGDPRNVFLMGHSAGAYNAVMLTLNGAYIKAANGERSWIKGTIGIAGPYDFLPFTGDVKTIFSTAKDADTQPINFVGAHVPPILLLVGDKDEDVLPRNSYNLAEKLRQHKDSVEVKAYPNLAHIGIILSLAHGFTYKAPAIEDIGTFIDISKMKNGRTD